MTINNSQYFNDNAALANLGQRLAAVRLNRNQTQAELAHEAGVSRRSVSKVENGHVVDTRVLIRVLQALELLDNLSGLFPEVSVSPVNLVHSQGKSRERATGSRAVKAPEQKEGWTWPNSQ
ncbi:MAG TPA: helix-turn-helix transcriptional regulator [Gammaproteobacteria bacterium]|nr:helix-turn-helix transcriptional regulator [Gammaproteobacteria bacterium]